MREDDFPSEILIYLICESSEKHPRLHIYISEGESKVRWITYDVIY